MNSDQQPPRGKGAALALLATTQFVVILDASIVNVALPSMGSALEFSQVCLEGPPDRVPLAYV